MEKLEDSNLLSYKIYFKKLWVLLIPISAQYLLLNSLNLIDTIMIGQLGDVKIAAVGIANQIYFLLNLLILGLTSGTAIFTAQYWGAKDIKSIKKITALAINIALLFSLIYFSCSYFFPEKIIFLFTKDENVIKYGAMYLKIASFSFIPMSISFLFAGILRTMHYVNLSLFSSFIGVSTNTVLNYILIFGIWKIPAMGVRGAALGTVIARFIELGILLSITYFKKLPCAISFKDLFIITKKFFKKYIKITSPVILNEMLWSIGVTIYTVIYARISTEAVAASNIAITIQRFSFILFIGVANASAVLIGNYIGEKKYEVAFDFAKKGLIVTFIGGAVVGLLVYLATPTILNFFKVSETVKIIVKNFMFFFIFIVIFKVENILIIVGIFRSGGDTKFALMIDVGSVWFVGIPLGLLSAFILKFPVKYVYLFIGFEEVIKFLFGIIRFKNKKWLNRVI